MDEIAFWVHTKRAPCLYRFDNIINKQNEQAHCSKSKPKILVVKEVPSPKKRNKRKLVLDDDSYSTEKEPSGKKITSDDQQQKTLKNGKHAPSTSAGSDIDFNIKNSSIQLKPKRMRLQKNNKLSYAKKSNIVTSTPKATAPRRSLRKSQKSLNNNTQIDNTKVLNNNFSMGDLQSPKINANNKLLESKVLGDSKNIKNVDQSTDKVNEKSKNGIVLNGQYEDLSDVSGFTANYIRSTKINSSKTPRNVRNKINKELQQNPHEEDSKTVICVNKSMNTGLPDSTVLNCSTDSSQNVINLVTVKSCEKAPKVSRTTSLLKFLDSKHLESKESLSNNELKQTDNNSSLQSSRYPIRRKNAFETPIKVYNSRNSPDRRKRGSLEFNNSDRKENPDGKIIAKTRSGRKIGQQHRQPENSVLVLSNSTEQISAIGAVNVADPENYLKEDSTQKKRPHGRCAQSKKSMDKSRQSLKRDKSGFSQCFSDSDNDSELLKQKKFFC